MVRGFHTTLGLLEELTPAELENENVDESLKNTKKKTDGIEDTESAKSDNVNHPSHYTKGGIECIQAIEASMSGTEFCGYLKGNVIKYLWRYRLKGRQLEDLQKAQWYLTRLTDYISKKE